MRIFATLLFFSLPAVDIFLTRELARLSDVSIWWWFAVSAIVGIILLRHERAYFRSRFMAALANVGSQDPHPWRSVLNSGRKVLAGVLLLIPGVLSDLLALTVVFMPLNFAARLLPAWAATAMGANANAALDGQYRRID